MKRQALLISLFFSAFSQSTYADESLLIKDYTTYYPLRTILEQYDYKVSYDASSKSILGINDSDTVTFTIGEPTYLVNNMPFTLDQGAPFIHTNHTTYVPIDYVTEGFEFFTVNETIPSSVVDTMLGLSLPNRDLADTLSLVTVTYIDYDGDTRVGNLVVHKDLAYEVAEIFKEIYDARFPIAHINLVDKYNADDNTSMIHNNTSAFNYRLIYGTNRLSNHAEGTSIDLNPLVNPHVINGIAYPIEGSDYIVRNDQAQGMIKEGDAVYNAFIKRGWSWGGHWKNPDYQHFEK